MKTNLFNMKSYVAVALCATAMLSTSCAKDEAYVVDQADAVAIVPSISGTPDVTRAAADIPYTPTNGKLSLYYTAVGSKVTTAFTYADDKWSAATPLFWDNLSPVGGSYPFFAVAPALPLEAPTASANQSTLEAYATSDQLVAFTAAAERRVALPLTFKHVLSQFKVTIKAGVSSTDPAYIDPATATLAMGGVRTAYTLSYADATTAIPAVATVGGDATSITPNAAAGSFYAVAPAQGFAAGTLQLTFTILGKRYTWSNKEAISSVAGMNIAINLSVQKTGITLAANGITLTDWDNSLTLDNQTVVVDGLTDGTLEDGNVTPLDGDVLELSANGKSATHQFEQTAWGSESPLHWDDMPAGSSTFKALYTPAAAAAVVGSEKDYYQGGAADVSFGAPINLVMTHAMSQVFITLKGDDSGLLETITSKSFNIKGLDTITLAAGISLKPELKAITFNTTDAYLVAPQALGGTSIKMVSSNGHSYTLKLSDLTVGEQPLTAFESGKSYAITVNVTDTEVTLSVTLKDWVKVSTDANSVMIDSLVDGTLEDSNIAPLNGDSLKLWSGSQVSTFRYDTESWKTTNPIYWSNMPASASSFSAFYTPSAAVAGSEKDYLIGGAAAVAFGSPVNLNMTHAMSQVKVVLKPGTGYTEASLLTKLSKREIALQKLTTITDNGVVTLNKAIANIAFASKQAYIVAPQTLDNASKTIKLTTAAEEHFYTLKLSALKVDGKALTAFEAGKSYTITLTVNDKSVSVSTTLSAWTPIVVDSKEVSIDGLTDGALAEGNITPLVGDALELQGATETALYLHNGSAWQTTLPIYWSNMPAGSSTFKALYTPKANAGAVGNELDYLTGSAANVSFGSAVNLKMQHAMAQVSVNLLPGAGYTAESLKAALKTSFMNMKGLKSITLNGGVTLSDSYASITDAASFANQTLYRVAPQVLTSSNTIKLTLQSGHTYTVDLSTLKDAKGAAIKSFVAGSNYAINVTVDNKSVSVSTTLKAWNEVATAGKTVSIDGLTDHALDGNKNITPSIGDQLKLWSGSQAAIYSYPAGSWTSIQPIYWSNIAGSKATFNALYTPATAPAGSEKDYLTGAAADVAFGSGVNLEMNHAMSQVKVVLKAGVGYANASFLAQLTGRSINLQKLASIADNGAVTLKTGTESITGGTAFTNEAAYIVAPQLLDNASKTIKLTTATTGHFYTVKFTDLKVDGAALTAFEAGKSYTITLTVDDKAVSISTNVASWSPIDVTETAVSLDGLNNDNPAEGNITLVNGDQLALEGANQNSVYLHNGTAWTATAPIYWSKASAGTSTFKALYTPKTAPAAGNEVDHLNGTASAAFGAPINLTMTHAMAQISVNLMGGNGLSMDAVKSVSIQMQPLASINLAGVELGAIETVIDAATFKNNTPYRVAPQALTAANNIKVTLTSGQTYTVDLSTLKDAKGTPITSFAAGSNYAIDVTLNDKEAAISTTLNAWNEASGNTAVEIDGLVGGDGSGTFSPTANDKLTILSLSGNKTANYTYNTSWTSKAPIYWGAIPSATDYGFKALYTPSATPTPGNEKDYTVGGTAKNVKFGAPINLTLNHAMAQVKITLKAGNSDFTDATLVDALTSRAINLQKMKATDGIDIDGRVALNGEVASITGTTAFGNATSYIVAPQQLTDANTIVLKLATGHTYTMNLNTVNVGGSLLTKLDAGTIYNITVTVNDTGISMGVAITDWNVIAGGGEAS